METLSLTCPDGSVVHFSPECAWLLTRPQREPRMIRVPTGQYEEVNTHRNGRKIADNSRGKGKRYRRKMIFEEIPDPEDQVQPVRVVADGWAFWRDGGAIMCERLDVRPLPLAMAEDAA